MHALNPATENDTISTTPFPRLTKRRIARTFGLKAKTYESHAVMQTEIISRLLPKIIAYSTKRGLWADLGCGTGILERSLGASPIRIMALDLAFEPLVVMRRAAQFAIPAVQADIQAIPFKPGVFEGAIIASVLQWLSDPLEALRQISRLLIIERYLIFGAFTKGSFFELFETLAGFGMQPPVNCPASEHLTKEYLTAGFNLVEHEIIERTLFFKDARTILKSISGMGATAREGPLLTRHNLERFCSGYEHRFRTSRGVPLTYRAMIGVCRKAAAR
jgi:ubiquinone/menaquinone biosynthesis C-methylase UbiE